jgi:HSP20 family molecular chaperone IbpA
MATETNTSTPAAPSREARERATRTVAPRVDICEMEKAYVLLADMPGVTQDGLDVIAERDTLIIKGRVQRPEETPDYQEFEVADYRRTFTITEDLDVSTITATLKDGVLRVEIPKSPGLQPKKIPVRTE